MKKIIHGLSIISVSLISLILLFINDSIPTVLADSEQTFQKKLELFVLFQLEHSEMSALNQLTHDVTSTSLNFNKQIYRIDQTALSPSKKSSATTNIVFGNTGISFPAAGQYRFMLQAVDQSQAIDLEKSTLPVYLITIDVAEDQTIQDIVIKDNLTNAKNDVLQYDYVLSQNEINGGNNPTLPNTGQETDKQNQIEETSNSTVNPTQSTTTSNIKRQLLGILHLPQTGSQSNKGYFILGYICLGIVVIALWRRKHKQH